MTTQNNNPFVLPGMGQNAELGQNPLLASMEMMRQAWQGMAGSGALAQTSLATPMTLEDLDRRIADLRTIENWLRLNLTMLSGTIQGLEVQRATIATLKSFAATSGAFDSRGGQSPLEAVLGINPAGQGNAAGKAKDPAADAKPAKAQAKADAPASDAASSGSDDVHSAASGWWNMLQKQFDTLAAATAATMQGAEAAQAKAQAKSAKQQQAASASPVTPVKTAVKSTPKAAAKAAPRKRATTAPKKTRA